MKKNKDISLDMESISWGLVAIGVMVLLLSLIFLFIYQIGPSKHIEDTNLNQKQQMNIFCGHGKRNGKKKKCCTAGSRFCRKNCLSTFIIKMANRAIEDECVECPSITSCYHTSYTYELACLSCPSGFVIDSSCVDKFAVCSSITQ